MKNMDTALRQPRSVLVVDADPDVLALLSVILEGPKTVAKPKLRVLRARNIREALDVLSRAYVPVDLVLANRALPEPDGPNIAERVHTIRPDLPVMFMSAISDAETIRIHGPLDDRNGLLRAVVAALEPPRAARVSGINSHALFAL